MAGYTVTAPNGKEYQWDGDKPPTRADILALEQHLKTGSTASPSTKTTTKPAAAKADPSLLSRATSIGPMIGSTVGGIAGGIAGGKPGAVGGAAMGGAAGRGYEDLIRHATDMPGAVMDTARGLRDHPKETAKGFVEGATGGLLDAGAAGAAGAGSELIGQGVGKVAKAGARKIMTFSLGEIPEKILTKYRTSAPELVQTLLDSGALVSRGGIKKLGTLLDTAESGLDNIIQKIQGKIDPKAVANRLLDTFDEYGDQVNPVKDLKAIEGTAKEFLTKLPDKYSHMVPDAAGEMVRETKPLSAVEAQTLKRGTYRRLANKYPKGVKSGREAGEIGLARGLKEELESAAKSEGFGDEVGKFNDTERRMMGAISAVKARLMRDRAPTLYEIGWAARHPALSLVGIASKVGIPLPSIIAHVLNGKAVPGVSALVTRAITMGILTPELVADVPKTADAPRYAFPSVSADTTPRAGSGSGSAPGATTGGRTTSPQSGAAR